MPATAATNGEVDVKTDEQSENGNGACDPEVIVKLVTTTGPR